MLMKLRKGEKKKNNNKLVKQEISDNKFFIFLQYRITSNLSPPTARPKS